MKAYHQLRRIVALAYELSRFCLALLWWKTQSKLGLRHDLSPAPRLLRESFERLGGLFVKLGQFIAMRPDIASAEFVREVERLLDDVAPFSSRVAVEIVERELNRPVASLFAEFEPIPIAAASFGQVHRATLVSGETVAVKVQRPYIQREVDADLRLMRTVIYLVDLTGITRRLRLHVLYEEFFAWTREELDYCKEAAFATAMRKSEVAIEHEYIPLVYWSHTTARVLTTEFLSGVWLSELKLAVETNDTEQLARFEARGIDAKVVAARIFDNMFRQAFERHMFHGDPHAGNLVILDSGKIGYIDFGITGQTDARFRDIQLSVLISLGDADFDAYFRSAIKFFEPLPSDANLEVIRRDIIQCARDWANSTYNERSSLAQRGSSALLVKVLEVARRHQLSLSLVATRYFRAVIAVEMMLLSLDKDFSYRWNLRRSVKKLQVREIRRQLNPECIASTILAFLGVFNRLPQTLIRAVRQAEQGEVRISKAAHTVRTAGATLFSVAARLLLAAALVSLLSFWSDHVPPWLRVSQPRYISLGLMVGAYVSATIGRRLYIGALSRWR